METLTQVQGQQEQLSLGGMSMVATGAPGVLVQAKYQIIDFRQYVVTENRTVTLLKKTPRAMTADKRPRNAADYSMKAYILPGSGGKWVGVPIGVNPDGTYKWKRFTIQGSKAFDLSIPEQAIEFFMWKNSQFFSGSQLAIVSGADDRDLLVVSDPERDSANYVERRMKASSMEALILNSSDEEIKKMGILFNINPATNSMNIIKRKLIQELNTAPDNFKAKVSSDVNPNLRAARMIFNMARFNEVIAFDVNTGMFTYKNTPVGADEDQVINKFLKDPAFAMAVKESAENEMNKTGVDLREVVMNVAQKSTEPAPANGNNQELLDLIKRQSAENAELRDIVVKQQKAMEKFLDALPETVPTPAPEAPTAQAIPAVPEDKPKKRRNGTAKLKAEAKQGEGDPGPADGF